MSENRTKVPGQSRWLTYPGLLSAATPIVQAVYARDSPNSRSKQKNKLFLGDSRHGKTTAGVPGLHLFAAWTLGTRFGKWPRKLPFDSVTRAEIIHNSFRLNHSFSRRPKGTRMDVQIMGFISRNVLDDITYLLYWTRLRNSRLRIDR